jgi:phage gpG-like protein
VTGGKACEDLAVSFTINLTKLGFTDADAALGRLDPIQGEKLLTGLGRLIREQTVERILGGGPSPDGAGWRDTIEMRNPILNRSGALARSIDYRASADSLVVGSSLIYAAIHQFGGVIRPKTASALAFMLGGRLVRTGKVTMPARPYLGLSAENRAEATRSVVAYLRRMLG